MRKSLRYLRITWTAFFGLACLLLIALWVRSYWNADSLTRVGNDRILKRFGTASGTLFFGCSDYKTIPDVPPPDETDGWEYQKYDSIPSVEIAGWIFNWGPTERLVSLPAWSVTLLLFTMATAPWIRWHFSLRTLLIATTLVAVVLGLAVYAARQ